MYSINKSMVGPKAATAENQIAPNKKARR